MIDAVNRKSFVSSLAVHHLNGAASVATNQTVMHALPQDEVELSPEATPALEALHEAPSASESPESYADVQRQLALQAISQATEASQRILEGLGLITGP